MGIPNESPNFVGETRVMDDVQGRPLIVSSGLENSNILRINNQPEIVIVDINKF